MSSTRVVWAGVAALVLVFLVLAAAVPEGEPEAGPAGSSFSTDPSGAAAYLALVERAGYEAVQARRPLAELRPGPGDTLVVIDTAGLAGDDADAVAGFVAAGGRAVVGSRRAAEAVATSLGWRLEAMSDGMRVAAPLAPVAEVGGVSELRLAGSGHWTATGPALPVAGDGERIVAAAGFAGGGRLVLLADAGPLQNRWLATADNARFALNLAGPPGGRVLFAESIHGFAPRRGLAALPLRWRWALAGLALAAAVWVASRLRRLGPPQPAVRPLPPPRAGYVEALAAALARTGRPGAAAAPVRAEARRLLGARAGTGGAPTGPELEAAAARLGLPPAEASALADGGDDPAGIVAAGRALALLRGGRRRP